MSTCRRTFAVSSTSSLDLEYVCGKTGALFSAIVVPATVRRTGCAAPPYRAASPPLISHFHLSPSPPHSQVDVFVEAHIRSYFGLCLDVPLCPPMWRWARLVGLLHRSPVTGIGPLIQFVVRLDDEALGTAAVEKMPVADQQSDATTGGKCRVVCRASVTEGTGQYRWRVDDGKGPGSYPARPLTAMCDPSSNESAAVCELINHFALNWKDLIRHVHCGHLSSTVHLHLHTAICTGRSIQILSNFSPTIELAAKSSRGLHESAPYNAPKSRKPLDFDPRPHTIPHLNNTRARYTCHADTGNITSSQAYP